MTSSCRSRNQCVSSLCQGVGAAVTSNRHPTGEGLNRAVLIEGSRFEWTAAAAGVVTGCPATAVAVRGRDLAITQTTFAGVGGGGAKAVSFNPSSFVGDVYRLEVSDMRRWTTVVLL